MLYNLLNKFWIAWTFTRLFPDYAELESTGIAQ